ncbi:response regulator [Paenibacillus glycinis]|uniref:Response regulator n=1 Tax=Paenibacillus glycinis TaxID=2697035 RepID=A0ABW9XUX6_9BACL|nr:response regulator [Paenibacillus glycinis]NBD26268.1 response regulator [Paenibacillus glycinis]
MHNVMIVDDEPLFREYLRTKFNWAALGMTVACEARHGLEALELAQAHRLDIALVDINMPFMDGLALSEQLKQLYPDISIVLVTGHNEFEYARRAIRMGVKDYLLKPFDEEEFEVTLGKVKSFMEAAHAERAGMQFDLLRESFLLKLISRDADMKREDVEAAMSRFRIPESPGCYLVAVTEIDHLHAIGDAAEQSLWKHTLDNLLRDLLTVRGAHHLFRDADGRTVSIVAFDDAADGAEFDGQPFARLGQMVERHFKFTVTVGIGRVTRDFMALRTSYREALSAIRGKLTSGQGGVIWFERLGESPERFEFFSVKLQENLIYCLRMKDRDGVEIRLDQAFADLGKAPTTVDNALTGLMGLVSLILSFAIESGVVIGEVLGPDFAPYRELRQLSTIGQCREWMTELYRRVMEASFGHRASKSVKLYEAAKELIHERFADPALTVETIAGALYIDSSYLRKIFRREGGMPVSDYLTYVRIQRAKELIGRGELKLTVIAEQVGYSEAGYFSKWFKKHFGVSPTEYENRKRP